MNSKPRVFTERRTIDGSALLSVDKRLFFAASSIETDCRRCGGDRRVSIGRLRGQPNRTIAAFLLWHAYIQRKGIVATL